ncbi:putative E3 SUMO-protein ligase RNF212 isoform X2 [Scleropages formosus]|uniref:putative E3 SUMO-protein ligase RNF212 isoform X2 n=1 Tax=Scleropages formosus TaxID=113540 RepID=UPI000877FEED|nr:probable E3 SUMO-protein ligase RNF212 isoform X2 [Scleropages formosus]
MSTWICCSSCFHPPAANFGLAVTSCGHIVCSVCFQKGKQGECLICKSKCQVRALSENSNSEVKAFFSDISTVTTKYFTEISKVLLFQARHRKRLLAYYQKKNEKLEELLYKIKQEMHDMNKKVAEQKAYIEKLENALKHQSTRITPKPHVPAAFLGPLVTRSAVQKIPYTSPLSLSRHPSSQCLGAPFSRTQPMDMNAEDQFRKPEISRSVSRLSLMSPPQEGTMGAVLSRSSSQSSLTAGTFSACSSTASREKFFSFSNYRQSPTLAPSPVPSFQRGATWETPAFKPSVSFACPTVSSLRPCPLNLARLPPKQE